MLNAMFALVVLTFIVMLLTGRARFGAVRRGQLSGRYFRLMSGEEAPAAVVKTGRHFTNLFEVPVLFYTAGVLYIALDLHEPLLVGLAWLFVLARAIHAAIHLSYNHPMHRFWAFLAGNLCVLAMWVGLILHNH